MKKGFHQLSIRLPIDILEAIEKRLLITKRSMNSEIISILEKEFISNTVTVEQSLNQIIKTAEDAKNKLK
jgi:hypothetical protein